MKKILKSGMVLALGLAVTTMGGCGLFFDNDSTTTNVSALSGYKICYNDNAYQLDNTFSVYAEHILEELFAVFAMPNTTTSVSGLTDKPLASKSQNFDRIRVQSNTSGQAVGTSWKWTFAKSFADCQSQDNFEDVIAYFTTERQSKYLSELKKLFLIPLEIVAIQIASHEIPQVFTVDVNESSGTTKVYTTSQKVQEVNEEYLGTVKAKFAQNGTYVGFTAQDVQTFKNYILTNIIGQDIVDTQYDSIAFAGGTKTYSQILDEILQLDAGTQKNFLTPFPASSVIDVTDTSYYPNTKLEDQLANIPAYEYQSLTLMPNKNVEIFTLTFSFWADKNLTIDIGAYYYNAQTQIEENLFTGSVDIKQNGNNGIYLLALEHITEIALFDESFEATNIAKPISNQNSLSTYFAYNGGAVLDKTAINSSFLTITFKPHGAETGYCPFKWAISSIFIGT